MVSQNYRKRYVRVCASVYKFLTLDTNVRLGYVGGGGGSVCTHVHSCSARGAVCKVGLLANNKHVGAKHTKYVCVCICIHRHRVSFIDTKLQF